MNYRRKSNVREDRVQGATSSGATATKKTTKERNGHFHAGGAREDDETAFVPYSTTSQGWLSSNSNQNNTFPPAIRRSQATDDECPFSMSLGDDEDPVSEKKATKESKSEVPSRHKSAANHKYHKKNKHAAEKEKEKEKRKEKHSKDPQSEKRGAHSKAAEQERDEEETSVSNLVPEEPDRKHKKNKNKHKRPSPSEPPQTSSTLTPVPQMEEPSSNSDKEKEKDKKISFRFTPQAQRTTVVAPPSISPASPSPSNSRNSEENSRVASRSNSWKRTEPRSSPAEQADGNSGLVPVSQNRNPRNGLVLPPPRNTSAARNVSTTHAPTAMFRARQTINLISPTRPTQRNTSPPVAPDVDSDEDDDWQPNFAGQNDSDPEEDNRHFIEEDDDDDEDDEDAYGFFDTPFDLGRYDTEIGDEPDDDDVPIAHRPSSSSTARTRPTQFTVDSGSDEDGDGDDGDDGHPKKKKKSSDEEPVTSSHRPSLSRSAPNIPTRPMMPSSFTSASRSSSRRSNDQQLQPEDTHWNGFARRTRHSRSTASPSVPSSVPPAPSVPILGPSPLHMHGFGRGGHVYHHPAPLQLGPFSRFFASSTPFEEDTDEERDMTGSGESLTSSGNTQLDRDAELARQLQLEETRSRGFMYIPPPPMPQPRWRNRPWGALVNEDEDDIPLPSPLMFGTEGVLARLSNMFHRRQQHNHHHNPPAGQSLATNPLLRLSLMTRELTENDYELLLSLDEPMNKGAKKAQISTLPTRQIQDNEEIKGCCICLAEMEPKSTVKTLPCNHYFHSECIDHWLQVNKVCPIDKKAIDGDDGEGETKKTKKS